MMGRKQIVKNTAEQDILSQLRFAYLENSPKVKRFFKRRMNKRYRNELKQEDMLLTFKVR